MTTADKMVAEQQYYNSTKIHFSHSNCGKRSSIFPTSGIESKMPEELKGITSEKVGQLLFQNRGVTATYSRN
jgi:hypothetical protein